MLWSSSRPARSFASASAASSATALPDSRCSVSGQIAVSPAS
jgi:hypothetical protein